MTTSSVCAVFFCFFFFLQLWLDRNPVGIFFPLRYLGEALLSCLRSLHLDARGFDLMAREPDVAGSVGPKSDAGFNSETAKLHHSEAIGQILPEFRMN